MFCGKRKNSRLHTSASKPSHLLIKEVKVLLKAKLIGLDRTVPTSRAQRAQKITTRSETYLQLWFLHFDP